MQKKLEYDTDSHRTDEKTLPTKKALPGRYFAYTATTIFFGGIIGMATELHSEDVKYLILYFSMSFFLAPALLIFPIIRMFVGEEKKGLAAFLSTLFGYYVQSNIKKRMDKY